MQLSQWKVNAFKELIIQCKTWSYALVLAEGNILNAALRFQNTSFCREITVVSGTSVRLLIKAKVAEERNIQS